ncbi:MAG: 2-oxoacid:acceptor oxidoreductase subunit alpha [Armatimonadetes bacterium]|nr:2-oxoacid:acceptor oxidoreductase subunit alpha [Armatimonadota bacterium]
MSDLIVKVGGEGGTDSPTTAGELITLSAIREGNSVFTLRTLPAEIKGGLATYQVRMCDHEVLSPGDGPDVLCCMNQEAYDRLLDELKPDGGVLVYDSDTVTPSPHANGFIYYGVPLSSISAESIKERRTKNMVLLGALAGLFGIPVETLKQTVKDKYGRRSEEVVAVNNAAIDAGFQFVEQELPKLDSHHFTPNPDNRETRRMVIDGSEAVAIGAAAAHCAVYAGYPITPASDIMHWLAKHLPKLGGTVIQTEDEISALGACLGASFAGARTMTATSGPGLSLMVELLGLGTMTELPVVVVDAMRGGPSTGLPTKCESGDLNLAVYGAHGDAPRIVVAPADIHDCLYDTIGAFNLAEKYQTPVILLSDQSMAMRTQAIAKPDLSQVELVQRKIEREQGRDFKRYELTEDGISAMAVPGTPTDQYHLVTGLAHDETGSPSTNDGELSAAMMDKRLRKIQAARLEGGWSRLHGPDRGAIGVISWGSLEGALVEATERLAAEGHAVRVLHLRMLSPLPIEELEAFAATVDKLVVCELNHSGQLQRLIRAETELKPGLINKYDGVPFTPREIASALRKEL